jgi:hypothetical protein
VLVVAESDDVVAGPVVDVAVDATVGVVVPDVAAGEALSSDEHPPATTATRVSASAAFDRRGIDLMVPRRDGGPIAGTGTD